MPTEVYLKSFMLRAQKSTHYSISRPQLVPTEITFRAIAISKKSISRYWLFERQILGCIPIFYNANATLA